MRSGNTTKETQEIIVGAVFGGKPLEPAMRRAGVPIGIKKWSGRWEFLYDVAVVNVEYIDAPFAHDTKIPLITDAIWLVEFEVAGDGTKVGEDVSKLRIARSENTLLIAAQATQRHPEKWLESLAPRYSEWVESRRLNGDWPMRIRQGDPDGRRSPASTGRPRRRPIAGDLWNRRRFPLTFQSRRSQRGTREALLAPPKASSRQTARQGRRAGPMRTC